MILKIKTADNDFTHSFVGALELCYKYNYKELADQIECLGIVMVFSHIRRSAALRVMFDHTRMRNWRDDLLDDREYLRFQAKEHHHYLDYFSKMKMTIEDRWPSKGEWDNGESVWIDTKRNVVETR